ncbi:MAG TPA: murein biosynthesis integral membrane protein MurJ [Thermoanaerobaculia bacterium]|nr:murein biosynthesis integral membrane protein MurJ [Thermoanaerobaculia bacterium]
MTDESRRDAVAPARRPQAFAVLVAAGILLSRIAGLIRQRVFAHYFGSSDAAGAFNAAMRIPNLLQNLFGEGVLSASFIPVYARLLAEGQKEVAGRVAGAVASFLALIVSLIIVLGYLLTPFIVAIFLPGFDGEVRILTIRVVRILFPATGLLVLSAWCLGILNSHRKFFLSYVAPVLWNAAMIATMIAFGARLSQSSLAVALAWGTVAGSALQFGIQLPFVFRYAGSVRLALDLTLEPVRQVFRNMGPVLLGRGAVQVSAYVDIIIASLLGAAAVATVAYAQMLYLLPISLFGMSVAAAELPQMASATGSREQIYASLRSRLERGLRQISFFVVPTIVAFAILGDILVAALYQTGAFVRDDTLLVWYILIGSTIGMLASTLGRLFNSTFYSMNDTRTPLLFAIVRVALAALLALLFAFPLRPLIIRLFAGVLRLPLPSLAESLVTMGAVGITLATGIAAWVEFFLLRRAIRLRIGAVSIGIRHQAILWTGALVAVAAAKAAQWTILPHLTPILPRIFGAHHIGIALLIAGVFGTVYLAITWLLAIPESRRILAMRGK